jgi:hypothetical protein
MADPIPTRWTTVSVDEVTWTLIEEAFRGFLLAKHLPLNELDSWADELIEIVREHLLVDGAPMADDQKDYTGRLCSRSFASRPTEHVDSIDVEGWGRCKGCGEVVNTRGNLVPEHLDKADDRLTDGGTDG